MTEKKRTIGEIKAEYGRKTAGILNGYHAEIDRIREDGRVEQAGYYDRLTAEQRMAVLRDGKREKADAARGRALDAYRREVEAYHEEVRARAGYVEGALFGMSSPESASVLTRAALASEEELTVMLDMAAASGNRELARAALIGAERRGFAGLVVRALEHAGPEAKALYAEYRETPPEEVLERQLEQAETIVAEPDYERLVGAPPINS